MNCIGSTRCDYYNVIALIAEKNRLLIAGIDLEAVSDNNLTPYVWQFAAPAAPGPIKPNHDIV